MVTFHQVEPGVWDGTTENVPQDLEPRRAARLMSEAGDIYQEALAARH